MVVELIPIGMAENDGNEEDEEEEAVNEIPGWLSDTLEETVRV